MLSVRRRDWLRPALLLGGLASGAAAVVLTMLAFAPTRSVSNEPLQATEPVCELGPIAQGSSLAEFELTNHTDGPLAIVHAQTTCRCAEVEVVDKVLAAGATTNVRCQWNTSGVRGRAASAFSLFYVRGDGTAIGEPLRQLRLQVQADVIPTFDYSPSSLEFTAGSAASTVIEFTDRAGSPAVHVLSAYCTHDAFVATLLNRGKVEVRFDPTRWPAHARLTPELRVETDCPTEGLVRIPLTVQPGAPLSATDVPSTSSGGIP